MRVDLLVASIGDTGGIQQYSRAVLNALCESNDVIDVRLFSLNDQKEVGAEWNVSNVKAFGSWPKFSRPIGFAGAVAWSQRTKKADLCFSTHPHLTKILNLPIQRFLPPVVTAVHGVEVWGAMSPRMKAAVGKCHSVFSVSEFTRGRLIEENQFDAGFIRVVPDTFEEAGFAPGTKSEALLSRYDLDPEQPLLMTVGRLAASESYKGQDRVIRALRLIRESHPSAKYIIVGSGDDKERLQRVANEEGQSDAVVFAGFVPGEELADHYRLCDVFVMPSTGEGFGIVFLEALACGRPCVVGNADASIEAIANGKLGVAVDPTSPEDIACAVNCILGGDHVNSWLQDPERLSREVRERFGFKEFQRRLLGQLREVLAS